MVYHIYNLKTDKKLGEAIWKNYQVNYEGEEKDKLDKIFSKKIETLGPDLFGGSKLVTYLPNNKDYLDVIMLELWRFGYYSKKVEE